MSRNQDRMTQSMGMPPAPGAKVENSDPPPMPTEAAELTFTTPTDFVDLPSRGRFYPEGHALKDVDSLEIRYMTAKDEDILTNKTLLRKGLALERLLQGVVIDKNIKVSEMLTGDRNAVLIATRTTGYGSEYNVKILCPYCTTNSEVSFDLTNYKMNYGETKEAEVSVMPENGTFKVRLPKMDVEVECRFLTGADETKLMKLQENKKKHKLPVTMMTDQFRSFITSVGGREDKKTINSLIDNMPASDSRFLRTVYKDMTPNVDLTQEFYCATCGAEEDMEVPFDTDFFWPKR